MKAVKWITMLLLSIGVVIPAIAQDDAYVTPSKARELKEQRLKKEAERRKRLEERHIEKERQEAERKAREEKEYQEYQNQVDDWYNRRTPISSQSEMEKNLDRLEGQSNKEYTYRRDNDDRPQGGKYTQRLRRFNNSDADIIILKNHNKVYVIDDYDYYDPWSDSYYGRDWDRGVNIIINNGPYRSYYDYWPVRWGWNIMWGYPWYDYYWYDRWYAPFFHYSWGWSRPYYRNYWRGYWSGYYGSYWDGYNDGWWDNSYRYNSSLPYSRYGRSSGYYNDRSSSYSHTGSVSTRSTYGRSNTHNAIYGRALGNSSNTARGYYNRSGEYVDRNTDTRSSWDNNRNSTRSSRWNRSESTRTSRSYDSGSSWSRGSSSSSSTRSATIGSGSSSSSRSSGSSGGGTRSSGGSSRRSR